MLHFGRRTDGPRPARTVAGSVAIGLCLIGMSFAMDDKQEKKLAQVVERLAKAEERVARGEPYKRMQLEFNSIRMELGRLPQAEARVQEALARLDGLEARSKGGAKPPAPATPEPAGPSSGPAAPPPDAGAPDPSSPPPGGAASGGAAAGAPAARPHPQQGKIASIGTRIDGAMKRLEATQPDKAVDLTVKQVGPEINALSAQDHEAVVALRARYDALVKRNEEVMALAAARAARIQDLKDRMARFGRAIELRDDTEEAADAYLGDLAKARALAQDAVAAVAAFEKDDPRIGGTELGPSFRDTAARVKSAASMMEDAHRAVVQRFVDQAQASRRRMSDALAASKPSTHEAAAALCAVAVAKRLAPERAADLTAVASEIADLVARSNVRADEIELARREAHRFPRPRLEGAAAQAIEAAFRPLFLGWREGQYKSYLRFAVTRPAWQLAEDWSHNGVAWTCDRYEWQIVHVAIPREGAPGVAEDRGFELRRAPGASEFRIHRSSGALDMLEANLGK